MVDLSVATEHSEASDHGVPNLNEFSTSADLRVVESGSEGSGYLAGALDKSLYTDRATTLKKHLDFAKICVDVEAMFDIPSAITMDLGDSSGSLKGAESDVIVPKVGSAGVVEGMVVDAVNESVNAKVVGGVVVGSDSDVAVVVEAGAGIYDAFIEILVVVDIVVSTSSGDVGSATFLKEIVLGVLLINLRCFVMLLKIKVVEEGPSRLERVAAGGVAELMDKLKPKEKTGKRKGKR
ncbi:hypothetical protein V6N13_032609 [Hibiscus sabdariffa]